MRRARPLVILRVSPWTRAEDYQLNVSPGFGIQIDVGECSYMDSTFLGTLTGMALRTRERNLPPIQLVNLHQRIKANFDPTGRLNPGRMVT